MEAKTIYFENTGSENTEEALRIAKQRADELGIRTIVVASTTGDTAAKAVKAFSGLQVIAVSHVHGYRTPDAQEFTEENRKLVESKGGVVLTSSMAFAGLSRAMRNKYNMHVLGDIIADTLRIFGHGLKVACEITLMAADNGLARTDEDIISIAGSDRGADTALVLRPVNTERFFDLKVKEIICKPRF